MIDSTIYNVEIELTEDLLGTIPKDKKVYAKFICGKLEDAGLKDEEVSTVEEIEGAGWTGFHRDIEGTYFDKGTYFLYDYAIKGFLSEAARTIKQHGAMKQLQDKFKRYVFVVARRVALPPIEAEPLERPLRASTAQGPRVTLARSDVVKAGARLKFQLKVLDVSGIKRDLVAKVLSYGECIGLGQWRSGSYGRFKVLTLEEE